VEYRREVKRSHHCGGWMLNSLEGTTISFLGYFRVNVRLSHPCMMSTGIGDDTDFEAGREVIL
jgi:hypothetical protein